MGVKVSYTESDRIDISVAEYNDLVRDSEKIAAVRRLVAANEYISTKDVMAILDIERKDTEPRGENVIVAP